MLLALTVASTLLAAVMTVVAWRASREERRRSAARVAALAQEIHGNAEPPLDLELQAPGIFAPWAPVAAGSRLGLALAVAAFGVATVAAAAVILSRDGTSRAAGDSRGAAPRQAASIAAAPLELAALGHERDGTMLTVHGVVRNPAGGVALRQLAAVVSVFDRDGALLASSRAPIDQPSLDPGGQSTFAVSIPSGGEIGRYRVSFRIDDRIVPHVDTRGR
jgi:hypothetical protein